MLVNQALPRLIPSIHAHDLREWPSETAADAGDRAIAATVCHLERGDGVNAPNVFAPRRNVKALDLPGLGGHAAG